MYSPPERGITVPSSAKQSAPVQHKMQNVVRGYSDNCLDCWMFIYTPIIEISPDPAQTTRPNPTLPEYLRTAPGVRKIPEPIITPTIMLTAAISPIVLSGPLPELGPLPSDFVLTTEIFNQFTM